MSTPEYQTIITSMVILPKGESIFSDRATTIRIEDEGGGPFLVIEQHPDDPPTDGTQQIRIDCEEWDAIREAVNQIKNICDLLTVLNEEKK